MECELFGNRLRVYKDSTIEKWKNDKWIVIKQSTNNEGYKIFGLSCLGKLKHYKVHRVIAFVYLVFDINNTKIQIDHMDRNKSNNHIENLRLCDNQRNAFNRGAKGYYKNSKGRYQAEITLNGKNKYLGCYKTEEEAREAYLEAKKIYHIF